NGAGSRGAVAPVDRGGEVACHLAGIPLIGEAGDRTGERRTFGRCDRGGKQRPEIAFGDGDGVAHRTAGEVRVDLGDHDGISTRHLVRVGTPSGDGETACRAANRSGGACAVAPIDAGGEIARGIGTAGVAEGCHLETVYRRTFHRADG